MKKLQVSQIVENVKNRGNVILEREVLLLKKRFNNNEIDEYPEIDFVISADQTAKGLAWLRKSQLKKNNTPRIHCELSDRDIELLLCDDTDLQFTLIDFIASSRCFVPYYLPVYELYSEALNRSLSYYVEGGKLMMY